MPRLPLMPLRRPLLALVIVAAALAASVPASAAVGTVSEFAAGLPAGAAPQQITQGPDGNLWATLPGANAIARITPTGAIAVFSAGITAGAQPWGIAAGPDGNVWFTEKAGNRIGRITPTGTVTEYPIPTAASEPWGIVNGPDGNLWFTASTTSTNLVGRITPAGVVTEFVYALGPAEQPLGITVGPDRNLWFVAAAANSVVQMNPQGQVLNAFTAGITAGAGLSSITVGPDGNLWFTEQVGNRIGRISPAGVVTEFPIAAAGMSPTMIVAGPDGNLWATENGVSNTGNDIVRVTPAGVMTQYSNGISPNAGVTGITVGPDANLWFTESNGNRVGRLLSGVVPTATAAPQIVGAPVIGTSLQATTGAWTNLPTGYAYRWLRCTTAAATRCSTVPNRTRSTYVLGASDQGRYLKVTVTARNLNGAGRGVGSATSAQVPTSLISVSRATVAYQERAVLVTTTVTTHWAGRITQIGTTMTHGRTVRRCRVFRNVAGPSSVRVQCRLPYASRKLLRTRSLYLTLSTTFAATGGTSTTSRQAVRLPARAYPWRPVRWLTPRR